MIENAIVFSTAGTGEEAAAIAHALVEARLAACVNIVPGVRSIYPWEGRIEDSPEHLLVIKTRRSLVGAVEAELRRVHSYAVPEVVAVDIVAGSADYQRWIASETLQEPREP